MWNRSSRKIIVVRGGFGRPNWPVRGNLVPLEDIRDLIGAGKVGSLLFRYQDAICYTPNVNLLTKPFKLAVLLRIMSRGKCRFIDPQGNTLAITIPTILRLALRWGWDAIRKSWRVKEFTETVTRLTAELRDSSTGLNLRHKRPLYLRTDLVFGLRSGGSVGHIAGVINQLDRFGGAPIFLTTDSIPTVRDDIETHFLTPEQKFCDFPVVATLMFNDTVESQAKELLGQNAPSFIYQRYSMNNYAGLRLARHYDVPFVLEFNGSEVWIMQNWSTARLSNAALSSQIESINVTQADLVVVVSDALKKNLIANGVAADRILVNPNGVDPDVYSPEVDGSETRRKLNLGRRTVLVFIGTFGRWHGVEVLAKAFSRLLHQDPKYRQRVRLLMIGQGVLIGKVREILSNGGVADESILTGLVPQEEGPAHLAACDVLVSPHVPNVDGTPFFGSPTKLFEYMAMGKGIVASDLEQIGQVLDHGRTAWLVEPGNVDSLTEGLRKLIDDAELRDRLGTEARRAVIARHTWREHVRRIFDALHERFPNAERSADTACIVH